MAERPLRSPGIELGLPDMERGQLPPRRGLQVLLLPWHLGLFASPYRTLPSIPWQDQELLEKVSLRTVPKPKGSAPEQRCRSWDRHPHKNFNLSKLQKRVALYIIKPRFN